MVERGEGGDSGDGIGGGGYTGAGMSNSTGLCRSQRLDIVHWGMFGQR